MKKPIKTALEIIMGCAIVVMCVVLWRQITVPVRFERTVKERSADVAARLADIRAVQDAFREKYRRHTASFDTLITFVLTDSLDLQGVPTSNDKDAGADLTTGSAATFRVAVRDTVFGRRTLSDAEIGNLRFIPHARPGTEFIMNAAILDTDSGIATPAFEVKAPYKLFLHDQNERLLFNLIEDAKEVYNRYPGLAAGTMNKTADNR